MTEQQEYEYKDILEKRTRKLTIENQALKTELQEAKTLLKRCYERLKDINLSFDIAEFLKDDCRGKWK